MKSSSPPPAPDYQAAAQAQGAQNLKAAVAQGHINNPNVVGPYGTQTTTWNGNDPTIHQVLNPQQQALLDQSTQTQQQLGALAGQGATALQGVVGKNLDLSGLPPAPGAPGQIRQDVVDAMMQRPTTDYNKQVDTDRSNMIAAGIPQSSKAYGAQMDMDNRALNDARQQAIIGGTQAAAQDYSQTAQSRQSALSELLAQRQTPLNEITALMSGSQVSNPFSTPGYAQNTSVAAAPVYNAAQQAGQYGTDVYNAGQAQSGNTQSGLFGLGGAAIMGGAML